MFPSKTGFIGIIGEVKDIDSPTPSSLITLEPMEELKGFMDGMIAREAYYNKGKKDEELIKFKDMCQKKPIFKNGRPVIIDGELQEDCFFLFSPLDFAMNADGEV